MIDCQEVQKKGGDGIRNFMDVSRLEDWYARGTEFLCPDVSSLLVQADQGTQAHSYFEISIKHCSSLASNCLPPTSNLLMVSMTTSIDFEQDESSTIIKYQSDLRNTLQLSPKLSKTLDLYFSESYLILEDSPWKISQYAFGFPKFPFFEFQDRF